MLYGMMYVPEQREEFALEVNLLDFSGDLYAEHVKILPTRFVRRTIRFALERDLIEQIKRDEIEIRSMLNLN